MKQDKPHPTKNDLNFRVSRRTAIAGVGVAGVGIATKFAIDGLNARRIVELSHDVAILKAESYDSTTLEQTVIAGMALCGLNRKAVAGKSVLLKPNMVEPSSEAPHINTHPQVVRATVEAFRKLDASRVVVAEGQGHVRDSHYVLEQSGIGQILLEDKIPFIDLNHDEGFSCANALGKTRLSGFFLPMALKQADLVVSMPKLKVHHWAGVTLSMKNLFGVLPGIFYGWPKNVLHYAGIDKSIMDITATVQPDFAIVDGVIGMEGDGPIMGTPRKAGLLIFGANPVAVDATGARLMGIDPHYIRYLREVDGILGPVDEQLITQCGERIDHLAQQFDVVNGLGTPRLKRIPA